jgi:hypothetical protein
MIKFMVLFSDYLLSSVSVSYILVLNLKRLLERL